MFKQLRKKMLILNLSILSVLIFAVFATLYLTTYNNVQREIARDINTIIERSDNLFPPVNPLPNPSIDGLLDNRIVSFVIITDLDGNITDSIAQFEVDDDFLNTALDSVVKINGEIELDGSYWSYKVVTYNNERVYAFLDITTQHEVLTNLIYTFVIIFSISFVAVYGISTYMTNRSLAKIKEAFSKQKQFVSNASHELKTPLAIINTNVDVLLSKDANTEDKWLNNIKFETNRMNQLTKDLLYLTKMSEQTPKELMKHLINVSELTESTILSFEALAYEKELDLQFNVEKDISTEFVEEQYTQVLHILLDNAIKYTPNKGSIVISLEKTHNQIIFKITNTGDGIKKEDLNNVFDRFYMADKARSINPNSYGLGLSIAKTIIDNHSGKIYCESKLNESTTFYIKLKN